MTVTLKGGPVYGTVAAIPSKSDVHRRLICAALGDSAVELELPKHVGEDIQATMRCLAALGCGMERTGTALRISPIVHVQQGAVLDCGESGSTLRFLMPVAAALGAEATLTGSGRLPERPNGPLLDALRAGGVVASSERVPITLHGTLRPGEYAMRGDVSSQYITGMLLALAKSGGGSIRLTTALQSQGYVDMTVDALRAFSVDVRATEQGYRVAGRYRTPARLTAEGDWSNAAFLLAAGALCGSVSVTGLDDTSCQGDREIAVLLSRFGAHVRTEKDRITVSSAPLHGTEIDLAQIPDLAPVLAAVAAFAGGETRLYGGERLRLKESDRIRAIGAMLTALGADCMETEDGLCIHGRETLKGGVVDAFNDHRIVMAAAVAALRCTGETVITGAQAVRKSYPAFFEDYRKIGGACDGIDDR